MIRFVLVALLVVVAVVSGESLGSFQKRVEEHYAKVEEAFRKRDNDPNRVALAKLRSTIGDLEWIEQQCKEMAARRTQPIAKMILAPICEANARRIEAVRDQIATRENILTLEEIYDRFKLNVTDELRALYAKDKKLPFPRPQHEGTGPRDYDEWMGRYVNVTVTKAIHKACVKDEYPLDCLDEERGYKDAERKMKEFDDALLTAAILRAIEAHQQCMLHSTSTDGDPCKEEMGNILLLRKEQRTKYSEEWGTITIEPYLMEGNAMTLGAQWPMATTAPCSGGK
jgi:hypothetical protein